MTNSNFPPGITEDEIDSQFGDEQEEIELDEEYDEDESEPDIQN